MARLATLLIALLVWTSGCLEGIDGSSGGIPPDPTVAVGSSHVVEATNGLVRIWDKAGNVLMDRYPGDIVCPAGTTYGGDPRVYWDFQASRFFLVSLIQSFQGWCLAVSATADPTGTWTRWAFGGVTGGTDFPFLATSDDKVVITNGAYGDMLVFNKADLLSGNPNPHNAPFPPPSPGIKFTPAQSLGSGYSNVYLGGVINNNSTSMSLRTISGVPGVNTVTQSTTTLSPIGQPLLNPPDGAVQQGTTALLQLTPPGRVFVSAVRRGLGLWFADSIKCSLNNNINRACANAISVKLSPTAPAVVDQTVVASAYQHDNFIPAVVTDNNNNLVMIFGSSGQAEYPSLYVTGRKTTDVPNTLRTPQLVKAGSQPYVPSSLPPFLVRWGDLFGATLDPSSGTMVYLLGQYQKTLQNGDTYAYDQYGTYVTIFDTNGF